jgi:two-component system nitrate/nitrite sensor histidine kinase NarX
LERGGKVTGLIEVMTRKQRRFSARDAQLLTRLAHHVVVAIENAKLYRQLKYLTVLEERDRLGREMHDHLSQTLGYINIKTSMVHDLLGEGQTEQVREGLTELKQAARMAYTDVREAIFNLRTPILPSVGLLGSLEEYLAEYRMHYGLDARLVVEEEDLAQISPEVANQLLRIIQEALVNVRKHADANKVRISYHQMDNQVCFTIEDNGRGFELDLAPGADQQHYGLQIMRERAESVGGSLSLSSQIGHGTRVVVCVPNLYQSEEGR